MLAAASVSRAQSGATLTTLHTFKGTDGGYPVAGLILGSDGNLYGTTNGVTADDDGTVYRLTTAGVFTNLHTFTASASDTAGSQPTGGLVQGGGGNLYGTTSGGGLDSSGTVFRITTTGALTTLYAFTGGGDGANPAASLILGSDGDLYGTTTAGGSAADGTIFRITTAGAFSSLYSFTGSADGSAPSGSLVEGASGTFYGTTNTGGADNLGTVFELNVYPAFFDGSVALADGVYYLVFPDGNLFGYYEFLSDPHYLYHFDLGFEYVFDANDGQGGVYFYDFTSSDFFYTSPVFPFPYLYDFGLKTFLYYYPDTSSAGHYTSNPRYFYDFATQQIITR